MKKIKFVIAGSGWRSLYYVRIARALPEVFELCAMYCRTEEKAEKMRREHGINAVSSIDECVAMAPDFVVVAVSKADIADVSMQWMDRGFTVLCETPAALNYDKLCELWERQKKGQKLVIAEQYTRYPENAALLKVLEEGILGSRDILNLSVAHEYHGASLMRAFLNVAAGSDFCVTAKTYEFPTVETMSRYERFTAENVVKKSRTVATFEFEGNKVCIYDFDSEQYRSPIRKNTIKLQGVKGEVIDQNIYYLDEMKPVRSELDICKRHVHTEDSNPNLSDIDEVTGIFFGDEQVYEPVFGLCGLSQDETAIATLMKETALYAREEEGSPYPLCDALEDAYMAILLKKACETGECISSSNRPWKN